MIIDNETILVTGATGFLGSLVCEDLLNLGANVIGIGRKESGYIGERTKGSKRFTYIRQDLATIDLGVFKKFNICGVIHLATPCIVDDKGNCNKDITYDDFYDVHVRATRKLIELSKQNDARFFIFPSSVSIYGKKITVTQISNETCPTPADYYGLTKYMGERLIEIELSKVETKGIILRYPLIFGRNHPHGLIYTFYSLAAANKPISILGSGKALRSPLYIRDAVKIITKCVECLENLDKYEIISCGSSNALSIREIAELTVSYTNSKSRVMKADKPFSLDWDMNMDIAKLKKKLKLLPLTVEDGLRAYLKDLDIDGQF
ncbi:MAG: NAD(P)-dependent oxidoreductase [Candidatus Omnitrophica bacterium]|nr:NAD(P)-dependent oxidoreductase [Candidatus Omnitrophota bacterium]